MTTKSKVIGSAKTELVIGTAAGELAKALVGMQAAISKLNELNKASEDLTLEINNKEAKISQLETDYNEAIRKNQVELSVKFKENATKEITSILNTSGERIIKNSEYQEMQDTIAKLKADNANEISKAVAIACNSLKADHKADITSINAQHQVKEAKNEADIKSLQAQVTFLTEQNTKWEAQLTAERQAATERSKASSVGTINVSSATK